MNHVDALSRNPAPSNSSDQPTEVELLHVNVTDSDWILAAQMMNVVKKFTKVYLDSQLTNLIAVFTKNMLSRTIGSIEKLPKVYDGWYLSQVEDIS